MPSKVNDYLDVQLFLDFQVANQVSQMLANLILTSMASLQIVNVNAF